MVYEIEKGIPLPRKSGKTSIYPWDKLEVGDSFAVSSATGGKTFEHAVRGAAHRAARVRGIKFSVRVLMENGVRMIRVWRTA